MKTRSIPPIVEKNSVALTKYFWKYTKRTTQEDIDYFNELMLEVYRKAQQDEREEQRALKAILEGM